MDFDNYKRPILGQADVVSKLQAKVAKQAKEISRLRDELQAVRDDLVDIKCQRDEMRRKINGTL